MTNPLLLTENARLMAQDFDASALREIAAAATQRAHWLTSQAQDASERDGLKAAQPFLRDADAFKMLAAWTRSIADAGDQQDAPKGSRTFAVEYRSPTGRIQTHRIEAPNRDEAMQRTVETLGIDFAAIQSTEERGA